jgi:hypothetical protein
MPPHDCRGLGRAKELRGRWRGWPGGVHCGFHVKVLSHDTLTLPPVGLPNKSSQISQSKKYPSRRRRRGGGEEKFISKGMHSVLVGEEDVV